MDGGAPPPLHRSKSNMPIKRRNSSIPLLASMDSLPEELLSEILTHLPADFLYEKARFVCPKWNKIIRSQAFINAHGDRHSTYGLLLTSKSLEDHHPVYVTATQGGGIETQELSYSCSTEILASSNGLALEFVDREVASPLRIINLVTKQPYPLPTPVIGNRHMSYSSSVIAYSAASNKYKVALPHSTSKVPHGWIHGLDILTVGEDGTWREVEVDHIPEDDLYLLNCSPLSTEGFVHWGKGRDVLTLDVETEILSLSQVPIPPPPSNSSTRPRSIVKCHYLSTGKRLSMLHSSPDLWCDVWEMTPENQEWRKVLRYRVDLTGVPEYKPRRRVAICGSELLKPIGWVKYLEVLAFIYKGQIEILYNLATREIHTIGLPYISKGIVHRNTVARLC